MTPQANTTAGALPSPLRAHLHISSCGQFERLAGHTMQRIHTENYLLIWVTQGKGHVTSQGQSHVATAGDLILLDHGPGHAYGADEHDPWSILWVHFLGPASRSFFEAMRRSKKLEQRIAGRLGHPSQFVSLHRRFVEMVNIARLTVPDKVMLQECLLTGMLGMMLHQLNAPVASDVGTGPRHDIRAVLGYIDEHLNEPLSLTQLASLCSVSERQFNRLFTEQMDTTPLAYIKGLRVNKACVLLGQTDMPVQEIAHTTGYDDAFYFSRLFRQQMGLSPSAYRNEKRGGK